MNGDGTHRKPLNRLRYFTELDSAFPVGIRFFWKKFLGVDVKVGDLGDVKHIMRTYAREVIGKRDAAGT